MASVITAILFVSALASTALAATKVSFPFTPISAASLPWWIAKESRYYEKYGLDVDMIYVGASPVIIQAMLGGQAIVKLHNVQGINIVQTGTTTQAITSLSQGLVDGIITSAPFTFRLMKDGYRELVSPKDFRKAGI